MPWPSVDEKRRSKRKTFKEATEEGQYLGHNNLWQWPLLVLIYKELSGMVRREGRAPCIGTNESRSFPTPLGRSVSIKAQKFKNKQSSFRDKTSILGSERMKEVSLCLDGTFPVVNVAIQGVAINPIYAFARTFVNAFARTFV